ncbi:MAG: outer membrane protein [Alphaproteobacteria bacterium]|nr:MAG: outer membrane protein [Alphaproteobacteria bacterium]
MASPTPAIRPVPTALAAACAVLLALPSGAADLPAEQPPAPPEPVPAATLLWSGTYVGVYGGYNWLDASLSGLPDVDSIHGPTGGAYLGYNYQFPSNWVTGLEGMAGISGASASNAGNRVEQDWEASLRARLGYAFENSLLYGLAGLAGSGVTAADATGSDDRVVLGWQVGAGLETFLTDNVTGRIEYGYTDYGSRDFSLGASAPAIDLGGHSVRIGLGFKF